MRQAGQRPGFWARAWQALTGAGIALTLACAAGAGQAATPGLPIPLPELAVQAARFAEPLVPTTETSAEEDGDLAASVANYHSAAMVDDFSALENFVARHPASGWRLAVLTNLGLSYYHYGYFSKAIDAFEQALATGQTAHDPRGMALADRAAGELLLMHARLGHADRLDSLLHAMAGRGLTGAATEMRDGANEGLWVMRNKPGVAYLCGPMALKNLLLAGGATAQQVEFLDAYRSGQTGVTLAEVGQLATQAGLPHRLIRRAPGAPVPVPSIIHWKVNHFAAIVGESHGRYEVEDPTFGKPRMWITRGAIDSEGSGYFLVPGGQTNLLWQDAAPDEAERLHGMGYTASNDNSNTKPSDVKCKCGGNSPGMTSYDFTEMLASLNLTDTPVGYAPPKGPPVRAEVTYNQREASQPATFSFFNVSPKWSLNWLSYVEDDPTLPGANVTHVVGGGGYINYSSYNARTGAFAAEIDGGAILSLSTAGAPSYTRTMPDGSSEVYGFSNGATSYPRLLFLTRRTDPFGNSVSLSYDSLLRLIAIVDATGRTTSFAYTNASFPLQVTKITDPFGRAAQLTYDSAGRLIQITDVLGLTSKFTYDTSSLVNSLNTPYGTTTFSYGDNGNTRYLQATDPLLYTERVEYNQSPTGIPFSDPPNTVPQGIVAPFNQYLTQRNTFYWDKHAYAVAAGDYTKARNRHWAHLASNTNVTSNTLESVKYPFENRIWYNYPGQPNNDLGTAISGTLNSPTNIGRVLDDGSTQLTRLHYNGLGNPTSVTDPLGRTTTLAYAPNQIDVTAVQQATAGGPVTTAGFTYNAQHLPLTYTDAAGQTTSYAYYPSGQIRSVTNALGQTTTYNYDASANLSSVVNANSRTAASFTYDAYDRVASSTDSEGWTVSYLYDALDRVTKETYPDGTARVYTYQLLDPKTYTDRQGRKTTYVYDAVRNLRSIVDPQNQTTGMAYYENGALKSLTDPNGHVTTWAIDLQNRVTGKTYADGKTFANAYEATTSRLHAVTDPLGQTRQYSYLADDRLAGIQYLHAINATPSVSFAYDPSFPRLAAMADGTGTTTYAYNPPGALGALRLAAENPPFANSAITYAYDALGRVTGRSVGGDVEAVAYDAIGRVISHASDLGIFQRGYLGQTAQLTIQRSGNIGTRWFYDTNLNDRRLTAIANSPVASRFQYATTPENDISAITESLHNQTWSYTYDLADRLKTAASSLGAANGYSYAYDAASNLTTIQRPSGATTVTPNSLNQVSSAGGVAFSYDANGNLLSDASRTYQWDADNRLIGIGYPGTPGAASGFSYDGRGRRVAIASTSGGITGVAHYGWCGETLCQARDANDTVTRRYMAEGEADLTDNALLYYSVDHLGSVRDVIALPSGLKSNHYDYEPYGTPTASLGSRLTWTDFRYAGLFYHQQSGLYLATYRAYDASTGRWLSKDPIGELGGLNLYAYTSGNPADAIDTSGTIAIVDNIVGGIINVAVDYGIHKATGQCYGLANFAIDFGLGFATDGLSALNDLRLAAKAARAAEGGEALAGEAYHYTFSRYASSIAENGLRPGSFATTTSELSPMQAQLDLALSSNRGLTDTMVTIDLNGLRGAGFEIPEATQVGRSFNMPGGGVEMQFPYAIPPEFLSVPK